MPKKYWKKDAKIMENASKIDTKIDAKIDAIPEPAIPLFLQRV